jgi:hypothetical protein
VSTTYPAFREAVRAAIVEASELDDAAVAWEQDGTPVAEVVVMLTVTSDVREVPVRHELEASGDEYTKTNSEMRRVAVQVRVESINSDALALANTLALKLERQAARDILDAECVLVDISGTTDHRYRAHGLWIQARSFELFTRIVLEDVDATKVGTIGTVAVQGESLDLPPEISLDEETYSEDDEP